jgi:hypothetical protein
VDDGAELPIELKSPAGWQCVGHDLDKPTKLTLE